MDGLRLILQSTEHADAIGDRRIVTTSRHITPTELREPRVVGWTFEVLHRDHEAEKKRIGWEGDAA